MRGMPGIFESEKFPNKTAGLAVWEERHDLSLSMASGALRPGAWRDPDYSCRHGAKWPSAPKRMLLEATDPLRTLRPLAEGLVVESLITDDKLSPTPLAKLLRRKKGRVVRRLSFAADLSMEATDRLRRSQKKILGCGTSIFFRHPIIFNL